MKFFIATFLILAAQTVSAITLQGKVLERGTKVPLKDVSVFVLPHKLQATTDEKGLFKIEDVPSGVFQFVINLPGYQKLEIEDEQNSEEDNSSRVLFVERENYSSFETVIVGIKKKKDSSQKSLTQAEFLTLPGSGGDPVKAVQNLPGVNRVSGFSSQVVIQGSAAKDTRYNIDGHEIPLVFHFGGLSSVVMPEALETVDYLSAGYESQYSRAMGGIISLQTRKPDPGERDKKGFFFVDTLKAGGLFESRIDENSSYLISARHSYIGLLLGKVAEKRDDFNLTVVPEFSDFTAIYHRKLESQANLKVVALASRDSLGFLLKEPFKDDPAFRGTLKNETIFYRLIPQWQKDLGSDGNLNLSLGVGHDQILVDIGA
ncbi:MAG: carboxypeptidase-like regulatory domain-containing protein, partial [Pseudobdellovibrionaceae bacterium]